MYKFSKYKEHYKANLKLALPIALAQLGQIIVQFVDNMMVGIYGGDDPTPLAAVSFGGSIFFLLFIAGMGLTMGLTPLIGELFVKGDKKISSDYLQNGIIFFSLLGIVITLLQLAVIPLIYHLGQPTEVVDMAIPYYKLLAFSVMPVMLFYAFKQFLEGVGNTKAEMYVVIICNVVNVGLNWIFIYGNFGFEPMGATGAGVGTLASRILMPIFIIIYFLRQERYRSYLADFSLKVLSLKRVKTLLRVGIPIATQIFLEFSAFIGTSIMMGWLGTAAISGNQITMLICHCSFMLILSISAATTIRVSHCYGMNDISQIKKVAAASYHLTMLWCIFTTIIFISLRNYIPQLFTSNPEVIKIASTLLIFAAIFQLSDGIQNISVGILRGIQDVKIIIPIAFVSYIILNLPVGYFFGFTLGMGPQGLILGFIFGLSTAGVLMVMRIRSSIKKLQLAK